MMDVSTIQWQERPVLPRPGRGDKVRYYWYSATNGNAGEVYHTCVEVDVPGFESGVFDPVFSLVQYQCPRDTFGNLVIDDAHFSYAVSGEGASEDDDVLDSVFGSTWRDFCAEVRREAKRMYRNSTDPVMMLDGMVENAARDMNRFVFPTEAAFAGSDDVPGSPIFEELTRTTGPIPTITDEDLFVDYDGVGDEQDDSEISDVYTALLNTYGEDFVRKLQRFESQQG